MAKKLVETQNFFIDTSKPQIGECRNAEFTLPQGLMDCGENQEMTLVLNAFSMRQNWYRVNRNNQVYFIVGLGDDDVITSTRLQIGPGNYKMFEPTEIVPPIATNAEAINISISNSLKFGIQESLSRTHGIPHGTPFPTTVAYDDATSKFDIKINFTSAPHAYSKGVKFVTFTIPAGTAILQGNLVYDILDTPHYSENNQEHKVKGYATSTTIAQDVTDSGGAVEAGVYNIDVDNYTHDALFQGLPEAGDSVLWKVPGGKVTHWVTTLTDSVAGGAGSAFKLKEGTTDEYVMTCTQYPYGYKPDAARGPIGSSITFIRQINQTSQIVGTTTCRRIHLVPNVVSQIALGVSINFPNDTNYTSSFKENPQPGQSPAELARYTVVNRYIDQGEAGTWVDMSGAWNVVDTLSQNTVEFLTDDFSNQLTGTYPSASEFISGFPADKIGQVRVGQLLAYDSLYPGDVVPVGTAVISIDLATFTIELNNKVTLSIYDTGLRFSVTALVTSQESDIVWFDARYDDTNPPLDFTDETMIVNGRGLNDPYPVVLDGPKAPSTNFPGPGSHAKITPVTTIPAGDFDPTSDATIAFLQKGTGTLMRRQDNVVNPSFFQDSFQSTFEILGGCYEDRGSVPGANGAEEFANLREMFLTSGDPVDNVYNFTGLMPATLQSEENIYLRTDVNSTAYQTPSFDTGTQQNVASSQVLAVIPLPPAQFATTSTWGLSADDPPVPKLLSQTNYDRPFEVVYYTDNGNEMYSVMIASKKISHLRLFVTDKFGRLIPEVSTSQIHCSGMAFTASLRINVYERET